MWQLIDHSGCEFSLASKTAITKVTVAHRDQVPQILVGVDLRINERVDFRIHILEAFECRVCQPCYHLLGLHLCRLQSDWASRNC